MRHLAFLLLALTSCAHASIPQPVSPPTPEGRAELAENAQALFARHEATGEWSADACQSTAEAFSRVRSTEGREDPRAIYMEGLTAARCGDDARALERYQHALGLAPDFCEARVALGLSQEEQTSRATFEEGVRRDPRCAEAYLHLASTQHRPHERDEALANLRRALAIRSDYLPALDAMAQIHLAEGAAHPERLELAAMVCRQAQLIDRDYAPLYNTWALVDLAKADLAEAAAKLGRARDLDPTFFEAHMNFAQLALSGRAYDDAARAFEDARRLRPESYDAVVGSGVAARALADPARAEAHYRAAIAIDGARPEAYFDLALLYQEHLAGTTAQLEEAEGFLSRFVARARAKDAEVLADTLRWCAPSARRCRPGRAQNLHDALVAMDARADGDRPEWTR